MDAPASPSQPRIAALIGACSIELSPRDAVTGPAPNELFDPGTTIFVNSPSSVTQQDVLTACARLQRAGFTAVPHVVARQLAGFTEASDFLQRLTTEAGITQILLLGGDARRASGPFDSALSLLSTGVVERHGIAAVAFAGYPETHPQIDAGALHAALRAKLEVARQRGLATSLVTQFGFEAAPIQRWIAARRAEDITCPIRIGLAGPATVATLAKYAARCGIGASLRALTHGPAAIARILTEANPDALIEALVATEDPAAPIDGLHIFSFGGAHRTAQWRHESLSRASGRG
jgi:methylenetetrahydrofolate reductase (NADPH)